MRSRIIFLLHPLKIALLDDLAVFWRDFGQDADDTGTERLDRFMLGFRLRNLPRQLKHITPEAVLVNQGITRHLKQPGTGIIQRAKLFALLHCLNEYLLQQVVGQMRISGTMPEVIAQLTFVRVPGAQDAGKRRRGHPSTST